MLGCVQQWTVAAGGEGGREGGVLRGGSALLSLDEMGCGERRAADADTPLVDVGFRIVRSF